MVWWAECKHRTLNDTGLMGVQAACDPGQAQKMLDVMCGACCVILVVLLGCLQG